MDPGSDDIGRRVLPLLLALYARPGSLRIATCPAQDAREGRLGEKDLYINKEMGVEFAERVRAELSLLPGTGHFPHLQDPRVTIDEVRAAFR